MPLDLGVTPDDSYTQLKDFITKDTVVQWNGGLYKVIKVNPKNFLVVSEGGERYNLRRAGTVKRAPRQDAWAGPEVQNVYTSEFKLGTPVRLKSLANRRKYGNHVWVIIALSSGNTFRLAQLGGTPTNSYLRGFTPDDIELVKGSFMEDI